MNTYRVQYTEDKGATYKTILVQALDYTKAYLKACFELPAIVIITNLILA